ncbi:MAG: hypothetical protein WA705_20780 [Candidatus Ozemobacteraceae bacterium]
MQGPSEAETIHLLTIFPDAQEPFFPTECGDISRDSQIPAMIFPPEPACHQPPATPPRWLSTFHDKENRLAAPLFMADIPVFPAQKEISFSKMLPSEIFSRGRKNLVHCEDKALRPFLRIISVSSPVEIPQHWRQPKEVFPDFSPVVYTVFLWERPSLPFHSDMHAGGSPESQTKPSHLPIVLKSHVRQSPKTFSPAPFQIRSFPSRFLLRERQTGVTVPPIIFQTREQTISASSSPDSSKNPTTMRWCIYEGSDTFDSDAVPQGKPAQGKPALPFRLRTFIGKIPFSAVFRPRLSVDRRLRTLRLSAGFLRTPIPLIGNTQAPIMIIPRLQRPPLTPANWEKLRVSTSASLQSTYAPQVAFKLISRPPNDPLLAIRPQQNLFFRLGLNLPPVSKISLRAQNPGEKLGRERPLLRIDQGIPLRNIPYPERVFHQNSRLFFPVPPAVCPDPPTLPDQVAMFLPPSPFVLMTFHGKPAPIIPASPKKACEIRRSEPDRQRGSILLGKRLAALREYILTLGDEPPFTRERFRWSFRRLTFSRAFFPETFKRPALETSVEVSSPAGFSFKPLCASIQTPKPSFFEPATRPPIVIERLIPLFQTLTPHIAPPPSRTIQLHPPSAPVWQRKSREGVPISLPPFPFGFVAWVERTEPAIFLAGKPLFPTCFSPPNTVRKPGFIRLSRFSRHRSPTNLRFPRRWLLPQRPLFTIIDAALPWRDRISIFDKRARTPVPPPHPTRFLLGQPEDSWKAHLKEETAPVGRTPSPHPLSLAQSLLEIQHLPLNERLDDTPVIASSAILHMELHPVFRVLHERGEMCVARFPASLPSAFEASGQPWTLYPSDIPHNEPLLEAPQRQPQRRSSVFPLPEQPSSLLHHEDDFAARFRPLRFPWQPEVEPWDPGFETPLSAPETDSLLKPDLGDDLRLSELRTTTDLPHIVFPPFIGCFVSSRGRQQGFIPNLRSGKESPIPPAVEEPLTPTIPPPRLMAACLPEMKDRLFLRGNIMIPASARIPSGFSPEHLLPPYTISCMWWPLEEPVFGKFFLESVHFSLLMVTMRPIRLSLPPVRKRFSRTPRLRGTFSPPVPFKNMSELFSARRVSALETNALRMTEKHSAETNGFSFRAPNASPPPLRLRASFSDLACFVFGEAPKVLGRDSISLSDPESIKLCDKQMRAFTIDLPDDSRTLPVEGGDEVRVKTAADGDYVGGSGQPGKVPLLQLHLSARLPHSPASFRPIHIPEWIEPPLLSRPPLSI